jgi:hypothetical protein
VTARTLGAGTALAALLLSACGSRAATSPPPLVPTATREPGACADPARDGVLGTAPRLERADRDLDGDGALEVVTVDRGKCSGGNCYWNVFVADPGAAGCTRYAGTLAGAALEVLERRGERRFADVRAWWRLGGERGGERVLLQEYRFRLGAYQLVDALLCRRQGDDRLACAPEGAFTPP